jgi:hypothetical protein
MQKLTAGFAALCVGLGLSSTAHAVPTNTRYVQKGTTAEASVDLDDPSGCIRGTLYVSAAEDTYKDQTGSSHSRSVFVNFVGEDLCKGLVTNLDTNPLPLTTKIDTSTFSYTFNLNVPFIKADAEDPVPLYRRLTGTLTITASGDFDKSHETNISISKTERVIVRSKRNTRDADAVVTNAKLANVNTNFLAGTGSIGETKSATVDITRY